MLPWHAGDRTQCLTLAAVFCAPEWSGVGLRIFRPQTIAWHARGITAGPAVAGGPGVAGYNASGRTGAARASSARPVAARCLPELRQATCRAPARPGPPACRGESSPDAARAVAGSLPARRNSARTRAGHLRGAAAAPDCSTSTIRWARAGPPAAARYLLAADSTGRWACSRLVAAARLGPRDAFLECDDRTRGAHIKLLATTALCWSRASGPERPRTYRSRTGPGLAGAPSLGPGFEDLLKASRPGRVQGGRLAVRGTSRGSRRERARRWRRRPVPLLALWMRTPAAAVRKPEQKLGQYPELVLDEEANWARREPAFGPADGRLRQRLERLGQSWERHPGEDLPAIFPHQGELRAATRLLHNARCRIGILAAAPGGVAGAGAGGVDSVAGTGPTTLNYTNLQGCTSRGRCGPPSSSRGPFVHRRWGTEGGRPLGVSAPVGAAGAAADPEADVEQACAGPSSSRVRTGAREKPQGVVVGGPRERHVEFRAAGGADGGSRVTLVAGALGAAAQGAGVGRGVPLGDDPADRARAGLGRRYGGGGINPQGGSVALQRARQPRRTAVTEIRRAGGLPPALFPGAVAPVPVWALEPDPPAELEWLLLSRGGSQRWAERIVSWSSAALEISGCQVFSRIEDRRLRDAEALQVPGRRPGVCSADRTPGTRRHAGRCSRRTRWP